jgi:hypothetical protein
MPFALVDAVRLSAVAGRILAPVYHRRDRLGISRCPAAAAL